MAFDEIPTELSELQQWVDWRNKHRSGEAKPTKVPYDPNGVSRKASSTDRATWGSFEQAVAKQALAAEDRRVENIDGIGFVFTEDDPYVGIDLDGCVVDGVIDARAQEIIDRLDSYWEISQSGTGVHIIARGQLPEWAGNRGNGIEIYDRARFFTMTGAGTGEIADRTQEIEQLAREYLQPKVPEHDFDWDRVPAEGEGFPGTDAELLAMLREDSQFVKLWEGQTDGDHSKADYSLCARIAELTGDHPLRIERLWGASALAQRPKWDREDYRERTISRAAAAAKSSSSSLRDPRPRLLPKTSKIVVASSLIGTTTIRASCLRPREINRLAPAASNGLPAEVGGMSSLRDDERYRGRAHDFHDLVKDKPPPKDWLIHGYLVRGRHVALAGAAGSGKTMYLWQLAVQASQDRPSEFPHDLGMGIDRTLNVAIVDAEMGPEQYHERTWDVGLNPSTISGRLRYIDAAGLNLRSQDDVNYLMEELDGSDLVIMDSLKALSPSAAENDNDDMASVTRCVTQIGRELSAGTMTIHHWGKEDTYRGASAILDQCDGMLAWKKHRPNDDDGFRSLSARGRHLKLRFAKEPPERWFRQIESGLLIPEADGPSTEDVGKWDAVIVALLPFTGTKKALAEACGTKNNNNAWTEAYGRVARHNGDGTHVAVKSLNAEEPRL